MAKNKYQLMLDEMLTEEGINKNIEQAKGFALGGTTFPIGRWASLGGKAGKPAAKNLQNWYKGLKPDKWGGKVAPGVSNIHLPVKVNAGLPATRTGLGNVGNILSNKAKLQLGAMGLAGTAGMGIGAYNEYNQDQDSTLPISPDSEPMYVDELYSDAPAIGAQAQAYNNNLPIQQQVAVSPKALFDNVKTVDPKIRALAEANLREKQAIADVNKIKTKQALKVKHIPKSTFITSDPGYKDGYRIDNVAASNPLSVYNIMDADNGSQGMGYEW